MPDNFYEKVREFFITWLTKDTPASEFPPCDFSRIQYEIRPADVLLIEGRSRISEVISRVTQSSWTHAALYIGRLHDIEDNDLRQLVIQHLGKNTEIHGKMQLIIEGVLGQGTVVSPLTKNRNDHIRICRPKGLTHEDAQLVINYAIGALGKPYSMRQVIDLARFLLPWSILPRRWGSSLFKIRQGEDEKEVCSSLIADAYASVKFPILPYIKSHNETGVQLIQRNSRLFTPRDFDYSPYFEIIKYPMLSTEEYPAYRRLPWNDGNMVSHDEGVFTNSNSEEPKLKKLKNLKDKLTKKGTDPDTTTPSGPEDKTSSGQ